MLPYKPNEGGCDENEVGGPHGELCGQSKPVDDSNAYGGHKNTSKRTPERQVADEGGKSDGKVTKHAV